MKRMTTLTLFLVFGVFFTSMFVTNDVSLIIFVPLTILLFGAAGKEKYILPVLTFQNIAAIRGSLLMPFGSPQNLFLYGQASVSAWHFMLHMLPLCVMSAALLIGFIFFLYRKDPREAIDAGTVDKPWTPEGKTRRIVYLVLFALIIAVIVTRTTLWPWAVAVVIGAILLGHPAGGPEAAPAGGLCADYHVPVLLCFFFLHRGAPGHLRRADKGGGGQ